jgi:hypothetical protein
MSEMDVPQVVREPRCGGELLIERIAAAGLDQALQVGHYWCRLTQPETKQEEESQRRRHWI